MFEVTIALMIEFTIAMVGSAINMVEGTVGALEFAIDLPIELTLGLVVQRRLFRRRKILRPRTGQKIVVADATVAVLIQQREYLLHVRLRPKVFRRKVLQVFQFDVSGFVDIAGVEHQAPGVFTPRHGHEIIYTGGAYAANVQQSICAR